MKLIAALLFCWLIYTVVKNISFGFLSGVMKEADRKKDDDISPFSDDEDDIGYNMEMADIIMGDDEDLD
ncbi:MAG: hypothetical protein MJ171_05590 [Clostridia bacterium]|nr:hypothetical protein [Clostridia bacterium]